MAPFLGRHARVYLSNDAGANFTEVERVNNPKLVGTNDTVDVSSNASGGHRELLANFNSFTLTFEIIADEQAAGQEMLWTAYLTRSSIQARFLGDSATADARQSTFDALITGLGQTSDQGDGTKYQVTMVCTRTPTRASRIPPPTTFEVVPSAYWKMDAIVANKIDDVIGTADLNVPADAGATIVNGAGRWGNALSFAGTGTGVVGAVVNLSTSSLGRSIVIWMKKTIAPNNNEAIYWMYGGSPFADGGMGVRNDGTGKMVFARHPHQSAFAGAPAFDINEYLMIGVAKKPDNSGAKYYINGIQIYDSTGSFAVNFGDTVYFGSIWNGGNKLVGALIDEAAVFTSELTASQMLSLYTRGVSNIPIVIP